MEKYNDLELAILSCLLQKPNLMEETILETKHFTKHYKIWNFMNAFYKKFKCFDFTLMMSISKNKYRMIEYIIWIVDKEPTTTLFKTYEKQLIELYEQQDKEKWIIEKIYELANNLIVKLITTEEFKIKIDEIYKKADEIFKR